MTRKNSADRILAYIAENPGKTGAEIVKALRVRPQFLKLESEGKIRYENDGWVLVKVNQDITVAAGEMGADGEVIGELHRRTAHKP